MTNKGFTLIELIVVIAIIAILASVAVPSYNNIQLRAAQSAAISNAQVIASCVNAHNAMPENETNIIQYTDLTDIAADWDDDEDDPQGDGAASDFNDQCDNQITITNQDFVAALEYISTLGSSTSELMVKTQIEESSEG